MQLANDRIRKLENELEIIHNSSFFKELTMKDKKAGIDQQYGKYSVHELCDAFSLPTSTYYNHLFRNKNEKAWYIERRAMKRFVKCFFVFIDIFIILEYDLYNKSYFGGE